jgi:hypothetical protein
MTIGSHRLVFVLALGLLYSCCLGEENTCDVNGVCTAAEPSSVERPESKCFSRDSTSFCPSNDIDSSTTKTIFGHHSLYRNGGTAQAYKANAPISPFICDVDDLSSLSSSLLVATWPFHRSSWKQAPQITFTVNLWKDCSNSKSSSDDLENHNCCCQSLMQNATAEAWQARPDGTYSSLRSGVQEGDCRTRMHSNNQRGQGGVVSSVVLKTLAPGSTGSLGGLGPNGWDTAPYGPPVIHLLITSNGYAPMLIDLPMLFDYKKTLQPVRFRWPDWRGKSWAATAIRSGKQNNDRRNQEYTISSWVADAANKKVNVTVDVVLFKLDEQEDSGGGRNDTKPPLFCQSLLPIFPSSFFLEPITECTPSLLDFFAL